MIEEVTQDHVAVGPAFARSVAFELRAAYEQQPSWQDPPIDIEHALAPSASSRRPELLSASDAVLADAKLCRTLKVCVSKLPEYPDIFAHHLSVSTSHHAASWGKNEFTANHLSTILTTNFHMSWNTETDGTFCTRCFAR